MDLVIWRYAIFRQTHIMYQIVACIPIIPPAYPHHISTISRIYLSRNIPDKFYPHYPPFPATCFFFKNPNLRIIIFLHHQQWSSQRQPRLCFTHSARSWPVKVKVSAKLSAINVDLATALRGPTAWSMDGSLRYGYIMLHDVTCIMDL